MKRIKVDKRIGKLYFSSCPNCNKYIVVTTDENTVTCSNCRKKYEIEYPEE